VNISPGVTLTVTSVISGNYSLKITGGGKAIFTGANTYTGQTIVDSATLQLGNGTTSGSIDSTSRVVLNDSTAILRFEPGANMAFSKVISGIGNVEFTDNGSNRNLNLTADNTYSGTTTIESGRLWLGNNTATGRVAGNIINNGTLCFYRTTDDVYNGVISGYGLVYKGLSNKVTLTGANTYTGSTSVADGTLQIGDGVSGSIDSTSRVVLNDSTAILRFELGYNMIFDKVISGSGKVEYKGSADNKILCFTADNQYTGTTTIESDGILFLGYNTPTGSVAGNIINNGGSNSGLLFNLSNDYTYSGIISGTGNVYINYLGLPVTATLNGANTYAGRTFIKYGTLALGTNGSIENSEVVLIGNNAKFDISAGNKTIKLLEGYANNEVILGASTLTINGDIDCSYNGIFSGTGGVTKLGTGKFIMDNPANTATGPFSLMAGQLDFSGKWAGWFNKNADGTLNVIGNPTIGGDIVLRGGDILMDLTEDTPSKITVGGAVQIYGNSVSTLKITATAPVTNYVLIEAASDITDTAPYALDMGSSSLIGTLSVQNPTKLLLTTVAAPTAIDNVQADNLKIYPNPTNGQLRVSGDILDGKDRNIIIFDVIGQVVFTSQLSNLSPETTIDISRLANGLYFLKVDGKMVKVVKE